MASLSVKPTQADLVATARRELLDTSSRWWTDTELLSYVSDWQMELQTEFEFVWGTTTVVTSTDSLTLTAVSTNLLRLDAIYWNDKRLVARTLQELEMIKQDWRSDPASYPEVSYQDDIFSVSLYPSPSTSGTAVFEYPTILSFTNSSSPISIPAWTRFSCTNYVGYRAFLRAGPNQDVRRATRRKAKFLRQLQALHTFYRAYFPDRYNRLRPGSTYEGDILNPNHPHLL